MGRESFYGPWMGRSKKLCGLSHINSVRNLDCNDWGTHWDDFNAKWRRRVCPKQSVASSHFGAAIRPLLFHTILRSSSETLKLLDIESFQFASVQCSLVCKNQTSAVTYVEEVHVLLEVVASWDRWPQRVGHPSQIRIQVSKRMCEFSILKLMHFSKWSQNINAENN